MKKEYSVQKNTKVILIIGVPHPGKKIIANIISEKKGYATISLDDLLTNECETNPKIKGLIEKSLSIDDLTMAKILIKRFSKKDCENGFILFGYPNSLKDAFYLYCIFSDLGIELETVIELKPSVKSLEDTIPKDDKLASELIEKIKYYNIEASHLMDYYTNKGVYTVFDSLDDPEKILNLIQQ